MHVKHHVIHLHTVISIPKGQHGMPNEKSIHELLYFVDLVNQKSESSQIHR